MLKDNIDQLILDARKNKDNTRLLVYQLIKTEIQKIITAKNAKPYTEAVELDMLKRMKNKYDESISQWVLAKRMQDANKELVEQKIISEYLPAPVNEIDIFNHFRLLIANGEKNTKDNMGNLIKLIKTKFPTADGALVAKVVKNNIN